MSGWSRGSIRSRITSLYALTMMMGLFVYSGSVYLFMRQHLTSSLKSGLQEEFSESILTVHRAVEENPGDLDAVARDFGEMAKIGRHGFELWDESGRLLHRSRNLEQIYRHLPSADPTLDSETWRTLELPDGRDLRLLEGPVTVKGRKFLLRAFIFDDSVKRTLAGLIGILAIVVVLSIGIFGLVSYVLAGKVLAPIKHMADRAKDITAERLGERISIANPDDELGRLATVFNEMFERLHGSFDRLRQFTADASHELRTPLTVIRSVAEVSLEGKHEDVDYYRQTIGSILEEVEQITRIIDSLLTLARADKGEIELTFEPVSLLNLAQEAIDQLEVLAEERSQTFLLECVEDVYVEADKLILRQSVINLVDNAIKYSPESAVIHIRIYENADEAILEVIDEGPGIAAEHQEAVFERFYRTDKGRSRSAGGTGLGLSIARWAVESSEGRIELKSEQGHGATFRIVLPSQSRKTC